MSSVRRSIARRCGITTVAAALLTGMFVLAVPPTEAAPVPWDYDVTYDLLDLSKNHAPAPQVVDWDGDGLDDLVVGFRSAGLYGGVALYLRNADGSLAPPVSVFSEGSITTAIGWTVYARPAVADWDGDGDKDLLYGQYYGSKGVVFCPNIGDDTNIDIRGTDCSQLWTAGAALVGATTGNTVGYVSPEVTDWDGDGDLDLLVGTSSPANEKGVRLYSNIGTPTAPVLAEPVFVVRGYVGAASTPGLAYESVFEPDVVDIDDDGDQDLMVAGFGDYGPTAERDFVLRQCLNTATNPTDTPVIGSCSYTLRPGFVNNAIDFHDWDGDGYLDLLRGYFSAYIPNPLTVLHGMSPDDDGDGIGSTIDNCPAIYNPADMKLDGSNAVQVDTDADGLGDPCDDDLDGDGVANTADNCVLSPNAAQTDDDSDGRGAACDPTDSEPGIGSYEWEQANRMEWGRKPVIMMRVDALSQSFRYDIGTSLIETALEKDVPITIAVIPWNEDVYPSSASAAWLTANAPDADLEIAQHGTYHACKYTAGSGPEFDCGMDESGSFNLMRVGFDSMHASITSTPSHEYDGFVPPEDGFDAAAMEAIRALGYRYLASGFYRYGDPDLAGVEIFEPDATGLVHIPWTQAACGNESAPWLTTHCDPFDTLEFPDAKPGGLVDRVSAELAATGVSSIIYEVASYDLPNSITDVPGPSWSVSYSYTADWAAIADFGLVLDGLKALTAGDAALFMTLGEFAAAKSITDDTPPVISIPSPTATEYTADLDVTVDFSATDDLSGIFDVKATLDGSPIVAGTVVDLAALGTGAHTLSVEAEDMAGNVSVETVTFTVVKRPTILTYTGDTSGQYSDTVMLTATLTDDGGTPLAGKTIDFTIGTQSTSTTTGATGQANTTLVLNQPLGSHSVTTTFAGDSEYASSATNPSFAIGAEDASIAFDGANPGAVEVAVPDGDSGVFSLTVEITETMPDLAVGAPAPGDIGSAVVSATLAPIGPGTPIHGTCTPGAVTGGGYDAILPVVCTFDAVPVNTYTVEVTVDGGYYDGYNEDVLVVYDPSLGFTTGGGWFYWPGTDDKTNFGYTMKYNKKGTKVSGSFLMIRHMDDGSKYRVKSNALYGLAIGEAGDVGWASFSGKATYLEPGWEDPIGNHEFVVYVEDHDQTGADDRFWLEMHDKKKNVIPSLSMDRDASDNTEAVDGGNIVVPHN
ncbi:MAG: FG-GAP-like repeat-containing protein [Actinomycetota bacterium]|nr:FG-GAP-like repeat-containing protein [Actinomycetota bacterium]